MNHYMFNIGKATLFILGMLHAGAVMLSIASPVFPLVLVGFLTVSSMLAVGFFIWTFMSDIQALSQGTQTVVFQRSPTPRSPNQISPIEHDVLRSPRYHARPIPLATTAFAMSNLSPPSLPDLPAPTVVPDP